jgi:hypothetical protein
LRVILGRMLRVYEKVRVPMGGSVTSDQLCATLLVISQPSLEHEDVPELVLMIATT